jgi:uracil-DNA glycosylase family 4
MSDSRDDQAAIAADLLAWIRQNEQVAPAWFLDDGSVAPELAGVERAAADKAPVKAAPARRGPKSVEAAPVAAPAADAVAAVAAAAAVGDPAFEAACAAFVTDTLALIDREGVPVGGTQPPDPLLAAHGGDKAAALATLGAEVLPCTKCPLHATRTHTVFGVGNPDADVVFIGEAPGQDEDLQGEPFVGRSGQLLTKILAAIDTTREDVYICNILKCRPPNNRDPLPAEVEQCEPHLRRQLAIVRTRAICCLGRVAAQTLLGTDASLGKLRQTVHFYAGIPVLVTFHPAALLRNPGWKRDTWDDVRRLRMLVDALRAR